MAKAIDLSKHEHNFQLALQEIAANALQYEQKSIRFNNYSEKVDTIISQYGWDRKEFLKEVARRGSKVPGARR